MDFESETFLTLFGRTDVLEPSMGLTDPFRTPGVRRLMPVECERLQGFPDGFTEWGMDHQMIDGDLCERHYRQADGTRYRQLGNAVAVPVAEWLGRRIKTYLR
jgi:DNA (cytosine-5)-methyltransferase 1